MNSKCKFTLKFTSRRYISPPLSFSHIIYFHRHKIFRLTTVNFQMGIKLVEGGILLAIRRCINHRIYLSLRAAFVGKTAHLFVKRYWRPCRNSPKAYSRSHQYHDLQIFFYLNCRYRTISVILLIQDCWQKWKLVALKVSIRLGFLFTLRTRENEREKETERVGEKLKSHLPNVIYNCFASV